MACLTSLSHRKIAERIQNKESEATNNERRVEAGQQWKKWDDEGADDKMDRIKSLKTVGWLGGNDCDLDSTKIVHKRGSNKKRVEEKIRGVAIDCWKSTITIPVGNVQTSTLIGNWSLSCSNAYQSVFLCWAAICLPPSPVPCLPYLTTPNIFVEIQRQNR